MKLESTSDYDRFKIMSSNRKTHNAHIRRLVRSMEENPGLFKHRPILVNDAMFIIDGQHRFEAARQLGIPVWYMVAPELTIKDTQAMNQTQRNWGPMDFARSHASLGSKPYQEYLKFREDFPHWEHGVTMNLLTHTNNQGAGSRINEKFKAGKLEIENLDETRELAEQLDEVVVYIREHELIDGKTSSLISAILIMMRNPDYDHEVFMRHLGLNKEIKYRSNIRDYLRDMEAVYNFGLSDVNRVRFF